ncbi:MAG: hypothetical protein JSV35_05705 [Candidatus Bathyarchaeota archaeon]|nr:MAG: hypothetical protein JSV35_05705 [Candidatus Bathyarchaeota archaeon]
MRNFLRIVILGSLLLFCFININVSADSMKYKVEPALIILEGDYLDGTLVTVNVTVVDAINLESLDIHFSWNTTYLNYVDHTMKVPVETYPDGVLHEPIILLKDEVDDVAGTYWLTVATLGGDPFNGNGTVFEMTFMVQNQPYWDEVPLPPNNYVSFPLLLDEAITPCEDGEVRLYAKPIPALYPMFKVMPEVIGGKHVNETFPVGVWLTGNGGSDLQAFWDVSGAEVYLHFNSSMIEALNITIDPWGWFASFWTTSINEIAKEINNTAGTVRVAFNASDDELHIPPFGTGPIFTVEFKSLQESSTWPPPSCTIGLKNPPPHPTICGIGAQVFLEGYQHPERDYCPWNNSASRVPLPHFVENATYHSRFESGVIFTIQSPIAKNYSREVLWLNVTANIPIDHWWFTINSGNNTDFIANTTITFVQCYNNLTIYASSLEMVASFSVEFYALNGDFDEDRDVDIFDIVILTGTYGSVVGEPAYRPECDLDPPPFGNGEINIFDVIIPAGNYGKSC